MGVADDERNRFWHMGDELVRRHRIVIDRPGGSAHPRYPNLLYPFDYGYLEGTSALDGGGVDCWVGSLPGSELTGVIVTVDGFKQDTEIKWLIGCTTEEAELALAVHRTDHQAALLIVRHQHD